MSPSVGFFILLDTPEDGVVLASGFPWSEPILNAAEKVPASVKKSFLFSVKQIHEAFVFKKIFDGVEDCVELLEVIHGFESEYLRL